MSLFRVQLQNTQQGLLDLNPSTATPALIGGEGARYLGAQMSPSKQRTIFVAGPHRIYRELFDGQTFTDSNYWKRFAFPQVPLDQSFISVVTDDGSIYSDVPSENTFPVTYGGLTTYNVASTDTFATKFIDIIGTYGGYAVFTQLKSLVVGGSASDDIKVQLNGSATAVFNLIHGTTQIFDVGDITISKIAFQGGVTANVPIEVLLSVRITPTS